MLENIIDYRKTKNLAMNRKYINIIKIGICILSFFFIIAIWYFDKEYSNMIQNFISFFTGIGLIFVSIELIYFQFNLDKKNSYRLKQEKIFYTLLHNKEYNLESSEFCDSLNMVSSEFSKNLPVLDALSDLWEHDKTWNSSHDYNESIKWHNTRSNLVNVLIYEISKSLSLGHNKDYIVRFKSFSSLTKRREYLNNQSIYSILQAIVVNKLSLKVQENFLCRNCSEKLTSEGKLDITLEN